MFGKNKEEKIYDELYKYFDDVLNQRNIYDKSYADKILNKLNKPDRHKYIYARVIYSVFDNAVIDMKPTFNNLCKLFNYINTVDLCYYDIMDSYDYTDFVLTAYESADGDYDKLPDICSNLFNLPEKFIHAFDITIYTNDNENKYIIKDTSKGIIYITSDYVYFSDCTGIYKFKYNEISSVTCFLDSSYVSVIIKSNAEDKYQKNEFYFSMKDSSYAYDFQKFINIKKQKTTK